MARVLVTDGEQRAALAIVRSLGRAGHQVEVAASRGRTLAGSSRYAARSIRVPDPLAEPERFADAVIAHAHAAGIDVLLPVTEASLVALLPRRAELAPAALPFPELETFLRICDKAQVTQAAAAVGISVPAQHVLTRPSDLDLDTSALRFPAVVKPARSVVRSGTGLRKLSVVHAADRAALSRVAASMPPEAYPLLVQQRIHGPGIGIFVLLWQGELLAAFSHERLREKPPSGGVSVYCESRPLDPQLLERSVALLRSFGWEGVAMVEFKRDAQSGEDYIMEINGRFWGSLQLAISAGVDFPRLLVDAALGMEVPATTRYESGVRSRWVLGDLDHLIARMRRSAESLGLPPGAPGRGRALLDFISASRPGSGGEIMRWSDPAPAAIELLDWLARR
jgi:predicted ATP-grasp superfamily ATP-dependent carboligase